MAKRSVRERLSDIATAIEKIEMFVAGYSFEHFMEDLKTHDAVVRNLEIISEASRHIPAPLKSEAPEIAWRQIADFGNLVRHGYEIVDDTILWDTIKRDLPPLRTVIGGFLARLDIE